MYVAIYQSLAAARLVPHIYVALAWFPIYMYVYKSCDIPNSRGCSLGSRLDANSCSSCDSCTRGPQRSRRVLSMLCPPEYVCIHKYTYMYACSYTYIHCILVNPWIYVYACTIYTRLYVYTYKIPAVYMYMYTAGILYVHTYTLVYCTRIYLCKLFELHHTSKYFLVHAYRDRCSPRDATSHEPVPVGAAVCQCCPVRATCIHI